MIVQMRPSVSFGLPAREIFNENRCEFCYGRVRVACLERERTVDDVLRSDVDQLNLLESQKVEGHLNVLEHVESHLAFLAWLK